MEQPLAITPRGIVNFACPLCGHDLLPSAERMLRCSNGHAYDVAREGHVHLAKRTNAKSAVQQAESDEAVRASRAFYEAGGFGTQLAGVAAEVSRALADCPDTGGRRQVLNAGCGEGAYLRLRGDQEVKKGKRPGTSS